MILYIDETENEEYFIVGGLLTESEQAVDLAYKKFKKSIRDIRIPDKYKSKVFSEFKATYLDHDYKKIKIKILEEIRELDGCVIYSCYVKKGTKFNQVLKESVYITLLSSILSSLTDDIDVVFDKFGKPDFEQRIIDSAKVNERINSIVPMDSQKVPGLQFADNVCSVIRLSKSGTDEYGYFELLKDMIIEVD